jgi:hypothetical protein
VTSGLHGYSTNNFYISVINTNITINIQLYKKIFDAGFSKTVMPPTRMSWPI